MENTSGVSKSMGIGFASSTQVGPVIPPDLNGPVGQPTESPPDQGGIFIKKPISDFYLSDLVCNQK